MSGIFTVQPAGKVAPSQVHDFMGSAISGIIHASIRPWLIADFEKGSIMKMFSKSTVLAGVTAALLGFSGAAAATGFTGYYALDSGNWTLTSEPTGGGGSVSLGTNEFTLTGSNVSGDNEGDTYNTLFTIAAQVQSTVSFSWTYTTHDSSGDSIVDPANFVRGVNAYQLTTNGVGNQSGTSSVLNSSVLSVAQGQVFGFSVYSVDSGFGPGEVRITNFDVSPVPEPGSLAMLTVGLMVVAAARKRKPV